MTKNKEIVKKEVQVLPKCYSDVEKEAIRNNLKKEAKKCMEQYGIKKTTVDELVKRVKIPKGTFYLFYPSKEVLLFEVLLEIHDRINEEVYQAIVNISKDNIVESFTEVLFTFYKRLSEEPVLNILYSSEIEILYKKLPKEMIEKHLSDDELDIEQLFSMFPVKKEIDYKVLSTVCHAIYFATLHTDKLDPSSYDEALKMMIRGFVMQIF